MKTAESWLKVGDKCKCPECIDLIKQIQLDAWKQGMADAADIVLTGQSKSFRGTADEIHQAHDERKSV